MASKKSTSKKVSKKSSKKQVKNNVAVKPEDKVVKKPLKEEVEDEPSWYHYVIVLLVVIGVFYGGYLVFSYFSPLESDDTQVQPENIFTFSRGERTFHIHFFLPVLEIQQLDFPIEFTEQDLFRTNSITLSFLEYNGTDNGFVTQTASKLTRLFSTVYFLGFGDENFVRYSDFNCSSSTLSDRVFVFDPYREEDGVFVNEDNGCVIVSSTNAPDLRLVGDALIYSLVGQG